MEGGASAESSCYNSAVMIIALGGGGGGKVGKTADSMRFLACKSEGDAKALCQLEG